MKTYIYFFEGLEEVSATIQHGAMEPHEMKTYADQNGIAYNIGLYFVEDPEGQPLDQGAFYKEA